MILVISTLTHNNKHLNNRIHLEVSQCLKKSLIFNKSARNITHASRDGQVNLRRTMLGCYCAHYQTSSGKVMELSVLEWINSWTRKRFEQHTASTSRSSILTKSCREKAQRNKFISQQRSLQQFKSSGSPSPRKTG